MKTVLFVVALGAIAAAQTEPTRTVDLKGKLYRSVFNAGAGVLARADLSNVPEPLRARLATYLTRRDGFKSIYKSDSDTFERARADAKKRALERAIVSLIDAPGVEQAAMSFVANAPIAYEWKGLHDGPLTEANYAESLLRKEPSSLLAPWLYVFIAERQRVAFETYENEKNDEGMKATAKKYRTFVERCRALDDPIFVALIEDMERQPYVYIKGTKHPRDFDPDA